jgi:hypothetical protein
MRRILLAALFSLGLAGCSETAFSSQDFACQPPRLAELSKQFASELCVHKSLVANLSVTGPEATGPALETAAHALLNHQENEPTDDPKAIRCRLLEGQTYCALNSYWASYNPPKTPRNGSFFEFPSTPGDVTPPILAVHG